MLCWGCRGGGGRACRRPPYRWRSIERGCRVASSIGGSWRAARDGEVSRGRAMPWVRLLWRRPSGPGRHLGAGVAEWWSRNSPSRVVPPADPGRARVDGLGRVGRHGRTTSPPDMVRARGETVPGGRCLPGRGRVPGAGRSSDSRARIRRSTYCPSLPRPSAQCLLTEVVPEHRCGAVPDSHRVPSCLSAVEVDDGEPVRGRLYVNRGGPCVIPACRSSQLACDAR